MKLLAGGVRFAKSTVEWSVNNGVWKKEVGIPSTEFQVDIQRFCFWGAHLGGPWRRAYCCFPFDPPQQRHVRFNLDPRKKQAELLLWNYCLSPFPITSHRQQSYMFGRGFRTKPLFCCIEKPLPFWKGCHLFPKDTRVLIPWRALSKSQHFFRVS